MNLKPLNKKLIDDALDRLSIKLYTISFADLNISEYNHFYLKQYVTNFDFYSVLYAQLLQKSLKSLKQPISESVFVDYGGGCGILSFLAKELGFKKVIYNDIYTISLSDAQSISKVLKIEIDKYVCGDIDSFVDEIQKSNIRLDLICSFDVLEHIYDLNNWFKTLSKIKNPFALFFMTSANSKNPFVVRRLSKMQLKAELIGNEGIAGWKERDTTRSFLDLRKKIIKNLFPQLSVEKAESLAIKSRGLNKEDIKHQVNQYIQTGIFNYINNHKTNTCDPLTGNWTEHLIDLGQLEKTLDKCQFNHAFTNSFYGYSKNRILNIPKFVLNLIIRVLGEKNLVFSPTYTLEINFF